jgi:hypothetical protein
MQNLDLNHPFFRRSNISVDGVFAVFSNRYFVLRGLFYHKVKHS